VYGGRLLEKRRRLGLSQDCMASLGRVAKRTYCNYESGLREPGATFLEALAGAGADVLYVLTGVRDVAERHRAGEETETGTVPTAQNG
jgi:transcriptional regulator with XRE-family HTH domain